ncbi:hexose transporter [Xylogone sp. PMI_703]|nr:hexose transporter [Xylogone sp. PMI_703]
MTSNKQNVNYAREAAEISSQSVIVQLVKADTVPWYRKHNLRLLYLLLLPAGLCSEITSGIDSSMLTGLQSVKEWNGYFHQPSGAILGLMTSAYAIGSFISLPIVAITMDRFGRKFAIMAACIWITMGSIIQGASVNIGMFVAARIIMGFGLPTLLTASAALLNELAYPKERSIIASLLSVSYYPGAIVGAGITFSTFARPDEWSWRIPSLCQMIPCLIQLVFLPLIPESPRWLIHKGRTEKAYDILAKFHAEGDRDAAIVKAEYSEIVRNIELEMNNSQQSWRELVATRANRWRCCIALMVGCYSQFSGNNVISYYLIPVLKSVGVTDAHTQNVINLSLSCWSLFVGVTASIIIGYVGRRHVYLYASCSMLLVFSGWIASSATFTKTGSHAAGSAVIAMLPLFFLAYQPGMNCLTYVYGVEIWPYSMRGKGITVLQIMSRGLTFVGNFCNPIGLDNLGWKYLFLYWSMLIVEIVTIYLFYPETKGLTLEEIKMIFEGSNEETLGAMMIQPEKEGVEMIEEVNPKTV